ncbi:DinB family protein [Confluentibacter sediminis]|uniref:DinB family protein n=1 Tax=Confluentibacter sediminis TaxID=2219045 RepID=UPI001C72D3D2|nr:DinB family protein [Confluentibacter sediminis]
MKQTGDSYHWTNELLRTIPFEKWDVCPDVVKSTLNWQVGHLIVSHYFHSVMVIKGHQVDILRQIPLKEYDAYFTEGNPEMTIGKLDSRTLFEQLHFMQKSSLEIIKNLIDEDLSKPLKPSAIPHPIAKNKLESLDWNIKHTMYHCGQIGILKRIVDKRHDFGLKSN